MLDDTRLIRAQNRGFILGKLLAYARLQSVFRMRSGLIGLLLRLSVLDGKLDGKCYLLQDVESGRGPVDVVIIEIGKAVLAANDEE